MRIARRFHFEAAHYLPHHDGHCREMHGHSYRLELVFTGEVRPPRSEDPQSGFVADFGRLRKVVQEELVDLYLDHGVLNERVPGLPYASAEFLAAWIMGWCLNHLENRPEWPGMRVTMVRLWETENSWAEAEPEDARRLGFLP